VNTILFGTLTRMLPIPYPKSGVAWNQVRDAEETALVSGGRHVYRAPTPFRRYNLSYAGTTPGLQNLIDFYNGVYGDGPFYVLDYNYAAGNLLPTRWASGYMLRHVAESWCAPVEIVSTSALAGKSVLFSNVGLFPEKGISQVVAVPQDKPLYLKVWGSRTGTAVVRVSKLVTATGAWTVVGDYVPTGSPADLEVVSVGEAGLYSAVKLELYCATGSSLTLDHLTLSTLADSAREPGKGVGAVQFGSDLSGSIVSKRYDRIGLSLDIIEVE
jgi:hypothetical protein